MSAMSLYIAKVGVEPVAYYTGRKQPAVKAWAPRALGYLLTGEVVYYTGDGGGVAWPVGRCWCDGSHRGWDGDTGAVGGVAVGSGSWESGAVGSPLPADCRQSPGRCSLDQSRADCDKPWRIRLVITFWMVLALARSAPEGCCKASAGRCVVVPAPVLLVLHVASLDVAPSMIQVWFGLCIPPTGSLAGLRII